MPSGASTGEHEAIELRDGDKKRFGGKGVQKAVKNVTEIIAPKLIGLDALDQLTVDATMLKLDGTETKSKLGANAILAVSLANAKAAAAALSQPLFKYLGGPNAKVLPVPMANVINGGAHSDAPIDFQEFMIMPLGLPTFSEGLARHHGNVSRAQIRVEEKRLQHRRRRRRRFCAETRQRRRSAGNHHPSHQGRRLQTGQGHLPDARPGRVRILHRQRQIHLQEKHRRNRQRRRPRGFLREAREQISDCSIEDGCGESDWATWKKLTDKIGDKIQLVGDDLFVTNVKFLQKGIDTGTANSILVKVNQIGSLTETLDGVQLAQVHGYTAVLSHRSGETEDSTIADIAVATNCGQIKTGSLSRSRPPGEIQPAPAHRAIARQERRLCRHERAAEGAVNI